MYIVLIWYLCQNEWKNDRAKTLKQNGHLFWKEQQTMTQAFFQNKHSCMNSWNTRLISLSYMFVWLTQTHGNVNTSNLYLFQNKQSYYYLVSQDVIKFCVKHRLTWQSVQLYKEKNPALLAVWSCINYCHDVTSSIFP